MSKKLPTPREVRGILKGYDRIDPEARIRSLESALRTARVVVNNVAIANPKWIPVGCDESETQDPYGAHNGLATIDAALAGETGERETIASERKRCADFCRAWLEDFGHADPKYISARLFVRAAIDDIIDGIESGKPLPPKDAGHD